MTAPLRGPFGLSLRRCLRAAAPVTLAAAVVAVSCEALARPSLDDDVAAAATTWFALPLLAAAVACSLAAAHLWPTFCRGRPGADVVRRLERGPLGGRGAVIAGALCAQALLTAPLAPLLARALGAPALAVRLWAPAPPPAPVLDRDGASLTFSLPSPQRVEQVWLRPIAALPVGGTDPTEVRVRGDGADLLAAPATFAETRELQRAAFPARALERVDLTRVGGHVPLLFGEDSVLLVSAPSQPTWQSALLVAGLGVATSLVALVIAALLGLGAGFPTVAAVIGALHFVQWIGGVGPIDDAALLLLRGQWPAS